MYQLDEHDNIHNVPQLNWNLLRAHLHLAIFLELLIPHFRADQFSHLVMWTTASVVYAKLDYCNYLYYNLKSLVLEA